MRVNRSTSFAMGAVAALVILFTTWFTIEPEEAGVVLRFGRFVRQVPSGLHMKLPYPLETVLKVPIERQLKEEFGFRTVTAGTSGASTYSDKDFEKAVFLREREIELKEEIERFKAERAQHTLPPVDLRENPVLWGSTCEAPGGPALSIGGQDQQLIGLSVELGPRGFGPGADVDRLVEAWRRLSRDPSPAP